MATQSSNNSTEILIVEDSDLDFEMSCLGVSRAASHIRTRRVATAKEFFSVTAQIDAPLALCIMDLNLPDGSGIQLAEHVTRAVHLRDMPVVVFTSSNRPEDHELAKRNGAKDCYVKPLSAEEYLRTVELIITKWLIC